MERTCPKCNRSFSISQDAINRYHTANDYATMTRLSNWPKVGDSTDEALNKIKETQKADLIAGSVSNPYICPYCGCKTNTY